MEHNDRTQQHPYEQLITFKGTLHKIVFKNPENNYIVARFIEEGKNEPVTIVGVIPEAVEGKFAVISGKWEYNPKFGAQIHIRSFQESMPSSKEAIERFLGSGLIEGIGHEIAKRIVDKFGEKSIAIIDNYPGRLTEVNGIGKKRVKLILKAWAANKNTRHIFMALNDLGLTQSMALRVFNKYKQDAINVIEKNPYRLAYDLSGIGFRKADEIALKAGISPCAQIRIESAVYYYLTLASEDGDTYLPKEKLAEKIAKELGLPVDNTLEAITKMLIEKKIESEPDIEGIPIYLNELYLYETSIAKKMSAMFKEQNSAVITLNESILENTAKKLRIEIDNSIKQKLPDIFNHQLILVTGGPGTGKTTIVRLFLELLSRANQSFALCAPTGRASKRLQETTGYEATTIHRLLEYLPAKGSFQRCEEFPLDCRNIIVDEVSMVDLYIMHHLLSAIKTGTRLILVGDADQLPSVGAGAILQNLVRLENIPKIVLNKIYRQAQNSYITINAHRINDGKDIITGKISKDFFFIERDNAESILSTIETLVTKKMPESFKLNPSIDIQVLSPMRKGIVGVENLNCVLREILNKSDKKITYGEITYKLNDKVMQIKNNYDLDVFNGDIGYISGIDEESSQITIDYDGKQVIYEQSWLDEIRHAYAISIHKSQGSEYPAVIIVVANEHSIMLQRNLLYTAVTRAKKLVVIVGSKNALNKCLHNNKIRYRYSLLGNRIGLFSYQ